MAESIESDPALPPYCGVRTARSRSGRLWRQSARGTIGQVTDTRGQQHGSQRTLQLSDLPSRLSPDCADGAGTIPASSARLVVFLPGIIREPAMETTSVTSKGQVTVPKPLRQQLGLRQGSKVEFVLMGDHVEMRVVSTPADLPATGFGMLKSKRVAVAADI